MEIETVRGVERLVTTCFGGVSILLGWNLFRVGVVDPQVGKLSGMGIAASLQRVGPGIFFALFGAAVLVTSLVNPLSIKRPEQKAAHNETAAVAQTSEEAQPASSGGGNGRTESETLQYASAPAKIYGVDVARAIGSLVRVEQSITGDMLTPYQAKQLSKSAQRLASFRNDMTVALFGRERVDSYASHINNANEADGATKLLLKQLDPWIGGTLEDGDSR